MMATMEFVYVPGGSYEQGCGSWTSDCEDGEKPVRRVSLSPFWLGKSEVTVGEFSKFSREASYRTHAEKSGGCWVYDEEWKKKAGASFRSPGFTQSDNHPASCLTWDDAQAFANWLSDKTGQHYRLPTEAEWEYACRSGGKPIAYGTDSGSIDHTNANCDYHENETTPAGRYAANSMGLQGMTGNVWERAQDVYSDSTYQSGSGSTDPIYAGSAGSRVIRGGSWSHTPRDARCSNRDKRYAAYHVSYLGFRLARTD
jgi:sulfatase modifying factor 1